MIFQGPSSTCRIRGEYYHEMKQVQLGSRPQVSWVCIF